MLDVIIIRAVRTRAGRTGNTHDLFLFLCRRDQGESLVIRLRVFVKLMAATLFRDGVQEAAFAAVPGDGAVAALNARKAAIAVSERSLVGVEKALRIDDRSDAGVGVLALVFPGEPSARSYDAFGMGFVRPQMYQVTAMAHPLIEDSGRVVLVKPELQVHMRIKWPVRLTQQPALPVCIFRFELRFAIV